MAASQAKQGLALAQQHHPDLIVLDLEIDPCGPDEVAAPFAEQSRTDHASLVLLGSVRRRQPLPQGEYVAKPYHYAPLIRRIEEILSANPEKVGVPSPIGSCVKRVSSDSFRLQTLPMFNLFPHSRRQPVAGQVPRTRRAGNRNRAVAVCDPRK